MECYFQEVFKESPKFTDLFPLLTENGFRLANLDYEGSGVQQSYFVPHHRKYGIFTGTEAVFIRSNEYYIGLDDINFVQVIAFLFCNKKNTLNTVKESTIVIGQTTAVTLAAFGLLLGAAVRSISVKLVAASRTT